MLLLLLACAPSEDRVTRATTHFDPISGTTLTDEDAAVTVTGLDGRVCYAVDAGDPGYGDCAELGADRTIALSCGFHTVAIRWGDGETQEEEANYLVDAPSCAATTEWVSLWQNDELLAAFIDVKDSLQCEMNDCENPSGTGTWSTACGDGQVTWDVSLDGLHAISVFTYDNCTASSTISVHDPADPYWQDETAAVDLAVSLTVDGEIRQDTDFDGNGEEAGSVTITGDFSGQVESMITIVDAARGGGYFESGCASGPVPNEVCAPGEAMIRYDFPDWSCHGGICPEPGDPPLVGTDTDGDGVLDEDDLCPEVSDPYQEDRDADGVGDACDDSVGFWSIQFETDERCLYAESGGGVSSTTSCIATDPSQQWEVTEVKGHRMFRNLALDACLSHTDSWIGPWTVIVETCDAANDFQHWDYETYDQGGAEPSWPGRLHAVSDDFCAYTDFTDAVYGTIGNCDLAGTESGRKVGIYGYGDLTTTPLAPG